VWNDRAHRGGCLTLYRNAVSWVAFATASRQTFK
jgi:hypothetical protein